MGEHFVTMMNDSVASHLAKPGMRDKLLTWHKLLGSKCFATFARSNIPAIYDARSTARFMEWYHLIGNKKFHTFLSGGNGKELLDDTKNQKIRQIYDVIGKTRSITLFSKGSFVKTVKDSADQMMEFFDTLDRNGERIFKQLKKDGYKLK